MKMVITIRHNIETGIRNLNERSRVNRINTFIAKYLSCAGLSRDVVDFNGVDQWSISGNLPELQKQLQRFPT
ncbi:MAG: hypothetical protein PHS33_09640, partial [Candidatus Omnitrophica bacterium]|nr:hypothetical protein [Candidatus Omnitrophota bacterium]